MRRVTYPVVIATLLLIAAVPMEAAAQQRGRARGKAQGGPSFCRSGAGHPVYGRQWCLDQGFGLGDSVWRRARPGKIKFGRVPQGQVETTRLGWRDVAEILTDVALDEIFGESSRQLDRSRLGGAWRGGSDDGLFVFELFLGDDPVAELTDSNLDGEVDIVLIAEH